MKRAMFLFGALLAIVCSLASRAVADEVVVSDADRLFRNFTREAATVGEGRFRVELRGFTGEADSDPELDLLGFPTKRIEDYWDEEVERSNGGVIDLLASYGLGEKGEVGFDVPYIYHNVDLNDSGAQLEQDFGDVLMYLKLRHQVADHCALGGGVEVTAPTGVEKKWLGTGETGVNTFASTRYQRGKVAVGAHVGYQMYAGNTADGVNYSVSGIVRASKSYALRVEFSGRFFDTGNEDFHDLVVMPGIDYNLTDKITIRPTGLGSITSDALDWGIGLGIAAHL